MRKFKALLVATALMATTLAVPVMAAPTTTTKTGATVQEATSVTQDIKQTTTQQTTQQGTKQVVEQKADGQTVDGQTNGTQQSTTTKASTSKKSTSKKSTQTTKSGVDNTLAVPPIFAASQYVQLNPTVAVQYGGDVQKMYQHYMTEGVRKGERLFATPIVTPLENLFLYMSYNRADYVKNGLSDTYPYFNVKAYMAANPLLTPVLGTNQTLWMYHYVNFGIYAGLSNGTKTDPAKVILWNSAVASNNNATLDPAKILANYTAITKQTDTTLLNTLTTTVTTKPTTTPTPVASSSSSSSHKHDWKYESIDDAKHYKKCRDCDEKEKEDHHYHVYTQTNGSDTSRHVLKCSRCDHKYAEAHYDKNNDHKCDKCGYSLPSHVHQLRVLTTGQTATKHKVQCATCEYSFMDSHVNDYEYNGGLTATHSHTCNLCGYVFNATEACDTLGTGGACSKCGHLMGIHQHDMAYNSNNNGTHDGFCRTNGCDYTVDDETCDTLGTGGVCSKCGYNPIIPPVHVHSYGNWTWNSGTTTHTGQCTVDGCTDTTTENCDHVDGGECSKCHHTYVAPHEHTMSTTPTQMENGKHKFVCTGEGCNYEQVLDCSYSNWQDNGDGTCTGTCECGNTKTESHAFGNWEVDSNDATKHTRECSHCGKTETEEHTYENHVCTKCTYPEPTSPDPTDP